LFAWTLFSDNFRYLLVHSILLRIAESRLQFL